MIMLKDMLLVTLGLQVRFSKKKKTPVDVDFVSGRSALERLGCKIYRCTRTAIFRAAAGILVHDSSEAEVA